MAATFMATPHHGRVDVACLNKSTLFRNRICTNNIISGNGHQANGYKYKCSNKVMDTARCVNVIILVGRGRRGEEVERGGGGGFLSEIKKKY